MLAVELFQNCRVAECTAEEVVAFGKERHWVFLKMPQKGVLTQPLFTGDWYYDEFDPDFTTLPAFAQRRLDAVSNEFAISQVIIGHEVEVAKEEKPKREIALPDIPWGDVAKVAAGVIVGCGLALAYGLAIAAAAVDPQLIVCLEGTEEWVCLAAWGE